MSPIEVHFNPDTTAVGPIEFRPWMIEVAWDYCQVVLQSRHKRGLIEQVIGALAIEVVLKSFSATVSSNAGQPNETYTFVPNAAFPKGIDKHNLLALANSLRPDVRRYLIEDLDEETVVENQDTFKKARYVYEPDAPVSSADAAIRLAVKMICKVMFLYKSRGCSDSFVQRFDVDASYLSVVQPFVVVPRGAA